MSADGRQARDVMLGLMKTCRKLGISFFTYLGRSARRQRDRRAHPSTARSRGRAFGVNSHRPAICPSYKGNRNETGASPIYYAAKPVHWLSFAAGEAEADRSFQAARSSGASVRHSSQVGAQLLTGPMCRSHSSADRLRPARSVQSFFIACSGVSQCRVVDPLSVNAVVAKLPWLMKAALPIDLSCSIRAVSMPSAVRIIRAVPSSLPVASRLPSALKATV